MSRLAAGLVVLLLASCSGPARSVRTLGAASAKGWRIEVSAIEQYHHIEGGLAPDREEWSVTVEARAKKDRTDARLGVLWSAIAMDQRQETADRWFRGMSLEHCGDGERVLLRLRAADRLDPPLDPRWHLFVLSPSVVAVQTRAATADSCRAALATVPAVDAWLAAALARPVEAYPEVRVGGAVLGQAPFPKTRYTMATERVSAFMLAAREGRRAAEAIDFALDRMPAYSELVRWQSGSDAYGPFDVLADERARLVEAVRRDPQVREHVRSRAAPVLPGSRPEVERWFAALQRAASD